MIVQTEKIVREKPRGPSALVVETTHSGVRWFEKCVARVKVSDWLPFDLEGDVTFDDCPDDWTGVEMQTYRSPLDRS